MKEITKSALHGMLIGTVIGAALISTACEPDGFTTGAYMLTTLLGTMAFAVFGGIVGGLLGGLSNKG